MARPFTQQSLRLGRQPRRELLVHPVEARLGASLADLGRLLLGVRCLGGLGLGGLLDCALGHGRWVFFLFLESEA